MDWMPHDWFTYMLLLFVLLCAVVYTWWSQGYIITLEIENAILQAQLDELKRELGLDEGHF